jgi:hypothetical protein
MIEAIVMAAQTSAGAWPTLRTLTADEIQMVTMIFTAVAALASAYAAWVSSQQIKIAHSDLRLQDQNGRVSVLTQLSDRWTEVLKEALYDIRKDSVSFANAHTSFNSARDFMGSHHWQKMRKMCNFYEFVGLLVFNKILHLETVLVIITVQGGDYAIAKSTIDRLRNEYRPDIYLFWDWLDIQCNSGDSLETRMAQKRKEIDALKAHWAQQPGGLAQHWGGGQNPFDPAAKPGI